MLELTCAEREKLEEPEAEELEQAERLKLLEREED